MTNRMDPNFFHAEILTLTMLRENHAGDESLPCLCDNLFTASVFRDSEDLINAVDAGTLKHACRERLNVSL